MVKANIDIFKARVRISGIRSSGLPEKVLRLEEEEIRSLRRGREHYLTLNRLRAFSTGGNNCYVFDDEGNERGLVRILECLPNVIRSTTSLKIYVCEVYRKR